MIDDFCWVSFFNPTYGPTAGTSESEGALPSGFNTTTGIYQEFNVGWGIAGGYNVPAPRNVLNFEDWNNPIDSANVTLNPRLGWGKGCQRG